MTSAVAAAVAIVIVFPMSENVITLHPNVAPSFRVFSINALNGTNMSCAFLVATARANGSRSLPMLVGACMILVSTTAAPIKMFNASRCNGLTLSILRRSAMKP